MNEVSNFGMFMVYVLLIPALLVIYFYRIGMVKDTIFAIIRMSIQLVLIGIYLKYLFEWNNAWLNFLWISFMVAVASWTAVRGSSLAVKKIFPIAFCSLFIMFSLVLLFFIYLISGKNPADATITIPIAGMLLGNTLRGNIIALDRFYNRLYNNEQEYLLRLLWGASKREAIAPFWREALRASIAPQVATMATMGIVSLPGMMTGQLLGGASPIDAIKYQIAIMVGIFCAGLFASVVLLEWVNRIAILPSGRLNRNIFATTRPDPQIMN